MVQTAIVVQPANDTARLTVRFRHGGTWHLLGTQDGLIVRSKCGQEGTLARWETRVGKGDYDCRRCGASHDR